ncbi:cilia- and flagella-associated protein 206 isoform X2 [Folsomia candida]|uniref:cilia- and flagella-associated protein 206 isoform X2 n=1 Tax=Folsomia candida TaxID=158441 RepID=UPI000B9067D2|nr:cilia- and flagella-associated protein 206 isoform X2 [Folsomia candida]
MPLNNPHIPKEEYHQTFLRLISNVQTCIKSAGVEVEDEFVVMIIKLVSLDPGNKFLIKQQMVESELERMKKIVVDRILAMSSMSRDIISMQFHFKMSYYNRDDSVYAHREDQENKISSLMNDMKTGIPNNLRQHDIWYAKLIGATIIEANMGSAMESSVVRETEAALMSVFPKEDMNLLSTMTQRDREAQLYHLMHIAIGIRLYSKDKNPDDYGEFIENLPSITPLKIDETLALMSTMRSTNIQRLIRYTTIAQPYFLRHVIYRMDRRAVNSEMVKIRQALAMVHQVLIYLKELTDDLSHEKDICSQLVTGYREIMDDLHRIVSNGVQNGDEVPRTVLHAKFVDLTAAWRDLQECQVFVESISLIVKSLTEFSSENLSKVDTVVDKILGESHIPVTEKEFFNFPTIKLPDDKYALAKRLDFREDLNPLQMTCSGFCVHSLVKGIGLLILSNPNLGIFNWKNQNYLLSTSKGAMDFRRDPDSYVKKVHAIARKWPELIVLLNIEKDAFDPGTVSDADRSGKTTNVLISTDAGAQTEIHPVESHIVKHYTSNEWDLRMRGLTLSKIHKCRTHGTQTHWQALKHNAEVQTFATKTVSMQTNRDVYSEIPLSQFYLYGLRGLHCGVEPHVVEISQDNPTDLRGMVATRIEPEINLKDELPFLPQIYYQN